MAKYINTLEDLVSLIECIGTDWSDLYDSDLRSRYKQKALAYHPDKNANGELMFKKVKYWYDILSDRIEREKLEKQVKILKRKIELAPTAKKESYSDSVFSQLKEVLVSAKKYVERDYNEITDIIFEIQKELSTISNTLPQLKATELSDKIQKVQVKIDAMLQDSYICKSLLTEAQQKKLSTDLPIKLTAFQEALNNRTIGLTEQVETSRQKRVDLLRKNKDLSSYKKKLQEIGDELVGSPSGKRTKLDKKRSIPLIEMRQDTKTQLETPDEKLKDDVEIIFEELLKSYQIPTNQKTEKTRESDRYTSVLESLRHRKVELKTEHKNRKHK